ncbi:MAG: hypothetical protein MJ252_14515 [archaeon]|nr:hypothetical protein [archaeon]
MEKYAKKKKHPLAEIELSLFIDYYAKKLTKRNSVKNKNKDLHIPIFIPEEEKSEVIYLNIIIVLVY